MVEWYHMSNSLGPYVGRFAPAPTGAFHLGNARTFLIAWLRARRAGGKVVLRLEDLDHPKVKPWAAQQAYQDLRWLGLDWDAGPGESFSKTHDDAAHASDLYVQSRRLERYAEVMGWLIKRGLIYPCVCTRKELDACLSAPNAGEDLHERRYPGVCRGRFTDIEEARQASGREPGLRFRVEDGVVTTFQDGLFGEQKSVLSDWSGDFLVGRGDRAGYQLAVVVDDHDMGVTEVVRGDDLLPSTHRQLALYRALGWTPPRFFHVPLVVGADGRRLAKRHGDTRLSLLREAGAGPEKILGWLAARCGWIESPHRMTLAEILKKCDFSILSRRPVVAGEDDLSWIGFL